MLRTTFALVLALGALGVARADRVIDQPETAFELRLADASVPAGAVGNVLFKTCDKCTPMSRLLTPSTRFFVGKSEVAAKDFMAAVDDTRKAEARNPRAMLALYVDVKTTQVTRAALMRPTR
jgi:hypothetical protein